MMFVPHHNLRQMELKNFYHVPITSLPLMKERILQSIYVMPAKITYVIFDEAPTWWYKEVALPNSRELEQYL